MKSLKLLVATLLLCGMGVAQNGFWTDRALGVNPFTPGTNGVPSPVFIAYGWVRVCNYPKVGSPCTNPAQVFDINGAPLSITGGNFGQLRTDVVGRFSFQVAPGPYQLQVAASGSNTPQLDYPITVPPSNLSGTIANTVSVKDLNQVWIFEELYGGLDAGTRANNACADVTSKGAHIVFPTGTLPVSVPITGCQFVTFEGAGQYATLLQASGLGANPIFNINGFTGVTVQQLGVSNGTPRTDNFTPGKDGIDITNCNNCDVNHVYFNGIEGTYGLNKRGNTSLSEYANVYASNTYCDSCNQADNNGDYAWDNTFGDLTCVANLPVGAHPGHCSQTYTFASGNDATPGASYSNNLYVWHNTATNRQWECYDSHGGNNMNFIDNVGLDCHEGVAIQIAAAGNVATFSGIKWAVEGNQLTQGSGSNDGPCVSTQGDGATVGGALFYAQDISVRRNQCDGFGSSASAPNSSDGTFEAAYVNHIIWEDNTSTNYKQSCFIVNVGVYDFDIEHNRCKFLFDAEDATVSSFLRFLVNLDYVGRVKDNRVEGNPPATFVRAAATWSLGGIKFADNVTGNVTSTLYSNVGVLPVQKSVLPTTALVQAMGDVVLNTQGQVGWTVCSTQGGSCNAASTGLASLDTTDTVVLVNTSLGNNTYTVSGAGTVNGAASDYRWVPLTMNVAICGAGAATFAGCADGATDLLCQVSAVDHSTGTAVFTMVTASGASCTPTATILGVALKYQGLVYASFRVDGSGNVSANTYTSTVATGTPPLTVASTTNVPNLNAATLNGATFPAPGTIGGTTPGAGIFTSLQTGTGGTALGLIKRLTDTPGAITVNANTCTDRSVADAGIAANATIMLGAAYNLDANIVVGPGFADNGGGNAHYRVCNVTGANITLNAAAAFTLTVVQ